MSSRLLDIARKFNVFYLNGKLPLKLFVLISHRHFFRSSLCNFVKIFHRPCTSSVISAEPKNQHSIVFHDNKIKNALDSTTISKFRRCTEGKSRLIDFLFTFCAIFSDKTFRF